MNVNLAKLEIVTVGYVDGLAHIVGCKILSLPMNTWSSLWEPLSKPSQYMTLSLKRWKKDWLVRKDSYPIFVRVVDLLVRVQLGVRRLGLSCIPRHFGFNPHYPLDYSICGYDKWRRVSGVYNPRVG
jgi:hypothetical protein